VSVILGVTAVALATVNVVGGYLVTDRMLAMFKKSEPRGRNSTTDRTPSNPKS
jgi:NAD(P) transhydrogenase subunit alpha